MDVSDLVFVCAGAEGRKEASEHVIAGVGFY